MDNYLKGISNINSESITIIRSFLNQKSEFPCVKNDPLTNDRGSWDNSDDETHVGVDDDITSTTTCDESEDCMSLLDDPTEWLKSSLIATSPNLDLIVFAFVQNFVILGRATTAQKYDILSRVHIAQDGQNKEHYITAVCAFNVASANKATTSIDWTCISIGLSSGALLFYTERGIHIFSEQVAPPRTIIQSIRIGASHLPGNQELAVLTSNGKCVAIEGLSLSIALKTARAQIARNERTQADLSASLQLNCHAYKIDKFKNINEFLVIGPTKMSALDQYITASKSIEGAYARVTRSVPTFQQYVAFPPRSSSVYSSFIWHDIQLSGSTIITDAFFSLTNQITSQLPSVGFRSLLGIGTSRCDRPPKKSVTDVLEKTIYQKSDIKDHIIGTNAGRDCERCYLAPSGWPLLAVTDSTARVILIHLKLRQIIRVWKGYRNAQCAWVESSSKSGFDPSQKITGNLRTLFLVIYAPKLGIMEVWPMQNGPRAIAFKMDGRGRLLYVPHGHNILIGSSDPNILNSVIPTTAAFISPDGQVYNISVPFHLSATDSTTAAVHDENLIKECRIAQFLFLSSADDHAKFASQKQTFDVEKLLSFVIKLRTANARRQFIESLLSLEYRIGNLTESEQTQNSANLRFDQLLDFIDRLIKNIDGSRKVFHKKNELLESHDDDEFIKYMKMLSVVLLVYYKLVDVLAKDNLNSEEAVLNNCENFQLEEFFGTFAENEQGHLNRTLKLMRPIRPIPSVSSVFSNMVLSARNFVDQFEIPFLLKSSHLNSGSSIILKITDIIGLGSTIFLPFLLNQNVELNILNEQLNLIPCKQLTETKLAEIFVEFLLNSSICSLMDFQVLLHRSLNILEGILSFRKGDQKISEEKQTDTLNSLTSIISLMDEKLFNSGNVYAAFLIAILVNTIRKKYLHPKLFEYHRIRIHFKEDGPSNESSFDNEHFDVVEDEHLELQRLHEHQEEWTKLSVFHLGAMCLLEQVIGVEGPQLGLRQLASHGYGYYREMLGNWISKLTNIAFPIEAGHSLSLVDVVISFIGDDYHDFMNKFGSDDESSQLMKCFSKQAHNCLRELRRAMFPHSLQLEMILGDSCWELAVSWYKDESRNARKLAFSIDFLDRLESSFRIQHGLALMIWETFLHSTFERLINLLESGAKRNQPGSIEQSSYSDRRHKASKDRLFRRDMFGSGADLVEYVGCVRRDLQILTASCRNLGGKHDFDYQMNSQGEIHQYEHILEKFLTHPLLAAHGMSGGISNKKVRNTLTEIADKHNPVNFHLVKHHLQLATLAELQLIFELTEQSPLIYFDAIDRRAFFQPLGSHPYLPEAGQYDERINLRRQKFIEICVEKVGTDHSGIPTMKALNVDDTIPGTYTFSSRDKKLDQKFLIRFIADEWKLDIGALQIKEISLLYISGLDILAEMICKQVEEKKRLGLALIPLILGRIKVMFEEESRLQLKVCQQSAAHDGTISSIKDNSDTFSPNFCNIDPTGTRKMVQMAKTLIYSRTKQTTEQKMTSQCDIKKTAQLLKEFEDICIIAEFLKTRDKE